MVQSKVECGTSRGFSDFWLGSLSISLSENIKKENDNLAYEYGCKHLLQMLVNQI